MPDSSSPITFIVWDLDGTLIDTNVAITRSANRALVACGYSAMPPEIVKKAIGGGLDTLFSGLLGTASFDLDALTAAFIDDYHAHPEESAHCYPGIPALLETIQKKGVEQAVLTNKLSAPSIQILTHLNILPFFTRVVGPDTYQVAKPNPAGLTQLMADLGHIPTQTLLIGDGETDILAARGAGALSLSVGYGFRSPAELAPFKPTWICDTVNDIADYLSNHSS